MDAGRSSAYAEEKPPDVVWLSRAFLMLTIS